MLLLLLLRRSISKDCSNAVPSEVLVAMEHRLSEQMSVRLSALELKEDALARAQRSELDGVLSRRFTEQSNVLQEHLRDVRDKMQQVGTLNEIFTRLDMGVSRFNTLLSNVKTRGTWGEVQLRKLLEDLLAPGQFAQNVKPNPRSSKIVEFALMLPGREEGHPVWVPIDSKFPMEDYERLRQAENEVIEETARRALIERLKLFATQVAQYITPPYTTDFAILFLPTEGLYLEASRDLSLLTDLQKKHILLTGPQTLAAFLNALQMGFRTLSVQKQAAKAWNLLVKTRRLLGDFVEHCNSVEKRLDEAHLALGQARGRIEQLSRVLRAVTLPEEETPKHA